MTNVELLEVNPEASQQLVLADVAFDVIRDLRDAGAITRVSLSLDGVDVTFERYEAFGGMVGEINRSCSWWLGDWIVYGEGAFGEKFAQALGATGLSEQTLLQRASVARSIPPNRRKANLSFGCHILVHRLDSKERDLWLTRAAKAGWSTAELKERMKAHRQDTAPPLLDEEHVDEGEVVKIARSIASNAVEAIDGQHFLVRREDVVRLRAALGQEE